VCDNGEHKQPRQGKRSSMLLQDSVKIANLSIAMHAGVYRKASRVGTRSPRPSGTTAVEARS
jgi:hypothetical protein